jgi:hypothetical protein
MRANWAGRFRVQSPRSCHELHRHPVAAHERSQQTDVILGTHKIGQRHKPHSYAPADPLPVRPSLSKFLRLGTFIAIGFGDPYRRDARINEGKDEIPGATSRIDFVEWISGARNILANLKDVEHIDSGALGELLVGRLNYSTFRAG